MSYHSIPSALKSAVTASIKSRRSKGEGNIILNRASTHSLLKRAAVDESNRLFGGVKPTLAMLDIYTTYTTYTIYTIYTHPNNPNNPSGRLITR